MTDSDPLAPDHASPSLNFRSPSGDADVPSIEELKAIQSAHEWGDRHVVWVGAERFVMAHTDAERASGMDLEECPFHCWLSHQDRPPLRTGYYTVEGQWDHEEPPAPDVDTGWKFTEFDPEEREPPPTPMDAVKASPEGARTHEVLHIVVRAYCHSILTVLNGGPEQENTALVAEVAEEMADQITPGLEGDLFARFDHAIADADQPLAHTTRAGERWREDA